MSPICGAFHDSNLAFVLGRSDHLGNPAHRRCRHDAMLASNPADRFTRSAVMDAATVDLGAKLRTMALTHVITIRCRTRLQDQVPPHSDPLNHFGTARSPEIIAPCFYGFENLGRLRALFSPGSWVRCRYSVTRRRSIARCIPHFVAIANAKMAGRCARRKSANCRSIRSARGRHLAANHGLPRSNQPSLRSLRLARVALARSSTCSASPLRHYVGNSIWVPVHVLRSAPILCSRELFSS